MKKDNAKKLYNPQQQLSSFYMPNWLSQVKAKLISTNAKALYCRLCRWSDKDGRAYRSSKQLGIELGLPPRTIELLLKQLRECNLIGTYRIELGGINNFEFYDHPWMHETIVDELLYSEKLSTPPDDRIGTPPTIESVPPDDSVGENNRKRVKEKKNTKPSVVVSFETDVFETHVSNQVRTKIQDRLKKKRWPTITETLIDELEFHVFMRNKKDGIAIDEAINGAIVIVTKQKNWKRPAGMPKINYHVKHEEQKKQEVESTPEQRAAKYKNTGAIAVSGIMKKIK